MSQTSIWLLDVQSGKARFIGAADDHVTLDGYVLNSHGTVVWISSFYGCLDHCTVTGTLTTTTADGSSTQLDQSRVVTPTHATPHAPIADLALSSSGLVVYWTDEGVARSARIP
jgi:hypothetical protein